MPHDRRVSFNDDPTLVIELERYFESLPEVATIPTKTPAETRIPRDCEDTVAATSAVGENGETLSPALAEDLIEQNELGKRLAKTEASRALLWERLRDMEVTTGVAMHTPPRTHRTRRVSFTQEPQVIPISDRKLYRAMVLDMQEDYMKSQWNYENAVELQTIVKEKQRFL